MPDTIAAVPDSARKMPDTIAAVPNSACKMPDTIGRLPDNDQERKIYQHVLENGSVTTAMAAELLEVKQRRARAILQNMVAGSYLRKEGAARSTVYVNSTEVSSGRTPGI